MRRIRLACAMLVVFAACRRDPPASAKAGPEPEKKAEPEAAKPPVTESEKPAQDGDIAATMAAFEKRKIYTELDPEILATIPDEDVVQAVMDYVFHRIGDDLAHEKEIVDALPKGFRVVYAVWWLDGEVKNGGYNQFFWNSSGQWADEAVAGFDLIGADEAARLTKRAIAIHREDAAKQQEFKDRNTMQAFSDSYKGNRLNPLDDEFYALKTDLGALLVKLIRTHPELFAAKK